MPGLRRWSTLLLAFSLILVGCSRNSDPGPDAPPPPRVATMQVSLEEVTRIRELPGRLEPWRVAQVRARVEGVVEQRLFEEGSQVEAGQPLFQIEADQYQAAYDHAAAAVLRSQALLEQSAAQLQRYSELVKTRALSQQAYDDARFAHQQAQADHEAARATERSARLDLERTLVRAPVAGRIGRSLVTEGALVGRGEVTHLATIHQLDPIYVNFTQSANELLSLQRSLASGADRAERGEDAPRLEVRLVLDGGEEHPYPGELLFSEVSVDPGSGQITLRALVPNPDQLLLPGLYVRARLAQQQQRAMLIPQQATVRTGQSNTVLVVDDEGRVQRREVTIDGEYDHHWIVTGGLQEGEHIVVEGLQKAAPGGLVTAVPWQQRKETAAR